MHTINKAVKFTYIFNLYLQQKNRGAIFVNESSADT